MNDNPGWFLLLFGVFSLPLSLPLTLLLSSTISLNSRCNAWYAVNINTLAHSHWFRYHWNWHRNSMEGEGYESKVAVIYMQYSLAVNRPLVIHYIQQHPLAKYAFKCYESIFFRSFSSTGCLCISDHRKTRIIRLHQVYHSHYGAYTVCSPISLFPLAKLICITNTCAHIKLWSTSAKNSVCMPNIISFSLRWKCFTIVHSEIVEKKNQFNFAELSDFFSLLHFLLFFRVVMNLCVCVHSVCVLTHMQLFHIQASCLICLYSVAVQRSTFFTSFLIHNHVHVSDAEKVFFRFLSVRCAISHNFSYFTVILLIWDYFFLLSCTFTVEKMESTKNWTEAENEWK